MTELKSQANEPEANETEPRCGSGSQGSSRSVDGRASTATSELMDVTAGETAPHFHRSAATGDAANWAIFDQAMVMLEDVPGETMLERLARLKDWYVGLQDLHGKEVQRSVALEMERDQLLALAQSEREIVGYIVERPGDQTFPRLLRSKAEAEGWVKAVELRPHATMCPVFKAAQPPAAPVETSDFETALRRAIDDLTVEDGKCNWAEVANILPRMRGELRPYAPPPRSSADTGQLKEALELADECDREFDYSRNRMVRVAKTLRALAAQPPRDPWAVCQMIVEEECYLDEGVMEGSPAEAVQPYGYAIRDRIRAARDQHFPDAPQTSSRPMESPQFCTCTRTMTQAAHESSCPLSRPEHSGDGK
jgi:hypothetical protein